jgi:pimeloyl-ACP methyl ester carboxylesterase
VERHTETVFVHASDGVKLAVECLGEGTPLYAIHGGPGSDRKAFGHYLDPISVYRRLCLPDQRGCGDSDDAAPESYTLERLAEDIEDTRAQLGHGKIDILGHSFGGPIVLTYALRWPESVSSVVIVDGTVRGWKGIVSSPRSWPLWFRAVRESFKKDPDWLSFTTKYEVGNPERVAEVRATLARPIRFDSARFKRLMSAGSKPINAAPLIRAGMSVLGIFGKQDRRFLADARYLRSIGARVKLIQNSGHTPFIEQPEQFHNALRQLLKISPSN